MLMQLCASSADLKRAVQNMLAFSRSYDGYSLPRCLDALAATRGAVPAALDILLTEQQRVTCSPLARGLHLLLI
jgi:hypothetical protein